ncbi:MAG: DM13 domain-containing protein [Hyphomicrobiaceae bacterium]
MNRKFLLTAVVAGFIGFVAGNAFWYLASPLWIDQVVNETLPDASTATTVARGRFKGADAVHKGSGQAMILRAASGTHTLRFTDFKSTNGPDLEVWLVKARDIKSASDVTSSKWISLGRLKGNIGNQNYTLPANVDPADYGSVVIWCEQFGVLFSSATLSGT